MKTGYCIKTIKYKLRCSHPEWLTETEKYYRQVLDFYFRLLLEHEEIWELNLLQMQGALERLTIAGNGFLYAVSGIFLREWRICVVLSLAPHIFRFRLGQKSCCLFLMVLPMPEVCPAEGWNVWRLLFSGCQYLNVCGRILLFRLL